MENPIIKEWLVKKEMKVYTVIVNTYADKINEFKPALFRKWLANELNIDVSVINLSSLNSALNRQRKKAKGKSMNITTAKAFIDLMNEKDFVFSKPETIIKSNNNFKEL